MDEYDVPLLRDYLYVDVSRVRSLLAQIDAGVSTEKTLESGQTSTGSIGGNLKFIEGSKGKSTDERQLETKSLTDRVFADFEELIEALGFLEDISDRASNVNDWRDGSLQRSVPEGSVIRLTAPARLMDANHFEMVLNRVADAWLALVDMGHAEAQGNGQQTGHNKRSQKGGPKSRRPEDADALRDSVTLGSPYRIGAVKQFVRSLYPGLSLHCYPCGTSHLNYAVSASLLDEGDYLREQRSVLFSRYGAAEYDWTIVGIVTRNGADKSSSLDSTEETQQREGVEQTQGDEDPPASESDKGGSESEDFDRHDFAAVAQGLISIAESTGLSEAPKLGSITLAPLAVYRLLSRFGDVDQGG